MLPNSNKKKIFKVHQNDPLYRIFEKHLYDYQYENRACFLEAVIEEYVREMSLGGRMFITRPEMHKLKLALEQELIEMLVRKLYGCLKLEESPVEEEGKHKGEKEELGSNETSVFQKYLRRLLTVG